MQTFPKNERLCGKTTIDNLFEKGSSIKYYIFRLVWNTEELDSNTIAQTLMVVPKKNIKNAANRNVLKRRMREAFRIHKSGLYKKIKSNLKSCKRIDIIKSLNVNLAKDSSMNLSLLKKIEKQL